MDSDGENNICRPSLRGPALGIWLEPSSQSARRPFRATSVYLSRMTTFAIRAERLEDLESIREVNRLAFGQDAEARLVDRLRADGLVVSSLVATEGPRVIGHLLFSELPIETDSAVIRGAALAPMSVIPSHQRQGIGSFLVREGLEECRRGGVAVVVVLGHLDYYPRFGFSTERAKCLRSRYSGAHFMALELVPRVLDGVLATVRYPPAFAEVD
jgi:putative acetyltransferase